MQIENQKKKTPWIKSGSALDRFLTKQFGSSVFSYRDIFGMLGPIVLDQFFISIIGLLTTAMISSSSQESVTAVSLVSPLYMMIYAIFNAISSGGTVIVAQYKGRNDKEKMRKAAGQVMIATVAIAFISLLSLILFSKALVGWMFSGAGAVVIQKAGDYLIGVAISLIFHSVYMGAFAVFRGIGETKICLRLTIIINLIHLFASMLFLNVLHLDILGTALSLNLARLIGGTVALYYLLRPNDVLQVSLKDIFCIHKNILKPIFKVGLPFALEQVFFNGGSMIVQTYMVSLGTICVAANAVANSAFSILYAGGIAVSTLAITVVGQCIGTGDKKLARHYGKKMIVLGTGMVLISIAVFYPMMPFILKLYGAPKETLNIIHNLLVIAMIPMPFFWSISNVMPCVLRAAGDSMFTSGVSLVTMWIVRVGLGYLAAIPFGLGVQGVWICMGIEWAVRTVIFYLRFHSESWLKKQVLKE
ncbi:MAG: MATE family efflux transporter [Acetivibrio sp.]